MLVLITYDVNTETPAGRKRLRKVAKRYFRKFLLTSKCILRRERFLNF